MQHALRLALTVSIGLHLLLLFFSPDWLQAPLPASTTMRVRLAAQITEPPPEVVQIVEEAVTPPVIEPVLAKVDSEPKVELKPEPKPKPKPEPKPKPKPKPKIAKPEPAATQSDSNRKSEPVSETSAEAPSEPAAPGTGPQFPAEKMSPADYYAPLAPPPVEEIAKLPKKGSIRFEISRGESGFIVGDAHHRWQVDGNSYRIDAKTRTNGLVRLFRAITMDTVSEGHIVNGMIVPQRFRTRKNGRDTDEIADFDWQTNQVRFGKDRQIGQLVPGAQDLLSFHYQFVGGTVPSPGYTAFITTGKKYEPFVLEIVGEEKLELPAGIFNTLHLRSAGKTTTELWLALDLLLLPVKVRYTERDGDVYNEIAVNIQISDD